MGGGRVPPLLCRIDGSNDRFMRLGTPLTALALCLCSWPRVIRHGPL